ncbi:MAG: methylenetetrahydrofolate reductase [NAD(P)H] [Proteobacteria bacterium]|nr:methylenetetrahydrofolate reductase [NAD(P)H] [Pseudomonadota bacterium]MBU1686535.1 methylenetetrahydrofolate reductase [NAD(P)H] [Pseudomonadota bacterium]
MLVKDILNSKRTSFSFEFFPPKTEESCNKLFHNIAHLMPLKPSYVSVTYGAGGSTRDRTHELVVRIQKETDLTVVSHLTCVGSSQGEIESVLGKYKDSGVENILALRGDIPKGEKEWQNPPDGFNNAAELVKFIKNKFPGMCIGVAGFPEGHPETPNRLKEIEYLKAKVDAGADYIVSQLFFDNRDFYDFCERCELVGIKVPILAGIMPITSRHGMIRMAELAGGARLPARLLRAVARAEDDTYVEKVGVHWATEQVRDLLDNNIRGIHFYTLNTSEATLKIYESLGVTSSEQLISGSRI